jgi:hypothetical protein
MLPKWEARTSTLRQLIETAEAIKIAVLLLLPGINQPSTCSASEKAPEPAAGSGAAQQLQELAASVAASCRTEMQEDGRTPAPCGQHSERSQEALQASNAAAAAAAGAGADCTAAAAVLLQQPSLLLL